MALLPYDESDPEQKSASDQVTSETPERRFDRQWAQVVMRNAMDLLQTKFRGAKKMRHFEAIKAFLSQEGGRQEYVEIGQTLGLTPGAVGVSVHRLRQKYRDCIRQEISRTVENIEDVEGEMRYLLEALL